MKAPAGNVKLMCLLRGSSWTRDLTNNDRETIATLRRRANSLDTTAADRRGSRSSLASQGSIWSWAGIEDVGSTARNPSPVTNVSPNVIDQSEIFEEPQNRPSEEPQNTDDEDDPFRKKVVVWSGDHQRPAIAAIDTASDFSLINKRLVLGLEAPVNRLTTPGIPLRTIGGNEIMTEGSVMLVLKFEDSPDYNEVRFHVLSLDSGLDVDLLLGMDWLATTIMYRSAREGI